jgi:hypothetical protein
MSSYNESHNILSSVEFIHDEHEDIVSMVREKKDVIPEHGITVSVITDYKSGTDEKFYKVLFRKATSLGTIVFKDLTIFDESLPVDKNIIMARIQKKFFELYAQYHYDFGDEFTICNNRYTVVIEPNVSHARCFDCYSWVTRIIDQKVIESCMSVKLVLLGDMIRECDCEMFL